jgi:hypothetical protein
MTLAAIYLLSWNTPNTMANLLSIAETFRKLVLILHPLSRYTTVQVLSRDKAVVYRIHMDGDYPCIGCVAAQTYDIF